MPGTSSWTYSGQQHEVTFSGVTVLVILHLMIFWILHHCWISLGKLCSVQAEVTQELQVKCCALCYGPVILTEHNGPFWHYKSMNPRNVWLKVSYGAATAFLSGKSYLGCVWVRHTVLCWGDGQRWELTFGLFTVTGIASTCSLQKYILSWQSWEALL